MKAIFASAPVMARAPKASPASMVYVPIISAARRKKAVPDVRMTTIKLVRCKNAKIINGFRIIFPHAMATAATKQGQNAANAIKTKHPVRIRMAKALESDVQMVHGWRLNAQMFRAIWIRIMIRRTAANVKMAKQDVPMEKLKNAKTAAGIL